MKHGRSQGHIRIVCAQTVLVAAACSLTVANAGAAITPKSSGAAALARRVAAATDARLVIAMHQQVTKSLTEVTYSDARRQIEVEFVGSRPYSGDIRGTLFTMSGARCYATTREPFVGLTGVGVSLLPQGSATGGVSVSYRRLGRSGLRWSIPATSLHGLEEGTVRFNSRDLILSSRGIAYKSGHRGRAEATAVDLAYPKSLPGSVPVHVPAPRCKP
jgi:hypothetical protein